MGCGHYNYSINAKQNEIDANQAEIRKLSTRKGEVGQAKSKFGRRNGFVNKINRKHFNAGDDLQVGCKNIAAISNVSNTIINDKEQGDGGCLSGVSDGMSTEQTRIQNEINRLNSENSRLRREKSDLQRQKRDCEWREFWDSVFS
jgi:hypothetical protein